MMYSSRYILYNFSIRVPFSILLTIVVTSWESLSTYSFESLIFFQTQTYLQSEEIYHAFITYSIISSTYH